LVGLIWLVAAFWVDWNEFTDVLRVDIIGRKVVLIFLEGWEASVPLSKQGLLRRLRHPWSVGFNVLSKLFEVIVRLVHETNHPVLEFVAVLSWLVTEDPLDEVFSDAGWVLFGVHEPGIHDVSHVDLLL
jgi:hypothetical protein